MALRMKLEIVGKNGRNLDKIDKLKAMKVISTIYNDKVKENKDPDKKNSV